MSDPLDGAQEGALEEAKAYMTGTVVPYVLGAMAFAIMMVIAFRILRWGLRSLDVGGYRGEEWGAEERWGDWDDDF